MVPLFFQEVNQLWKNLELLSPFVNNFFLDISPNTDDWKGTNTPIYYAMIKSKSGLAVYSIVSIHFLFILVFKQHNTYLHIVCCCF